MPVTARQPFTFGGVARYASAPMGRLLGTAFLFAVLAGAIVLMLAARCWWPVISEAVEALPETLRLQNGQLQTQAKGAGLLAANQFLSLQIANGQGTEESAPGDLAVQFGKTALIATSLLGESVLPYPDALNLTLDRATVWPWWGAWKFPLLAGLGVVSFILLIFIWTVLALVYAPIALAFAGLARRGLNYFCAWKLSVAAQLPASLLMAFALALYASGEIGLPFITIMFAAHFVPSLLNIIVAPFFLPKIEKSEKVRSRKNPFRDEKGQPKRNTKRNPFQTTPGDD